jgi:hypothetical protein
MKSDKKCLEFYEYNKIFPTFNAICCAFIPTIVRIDANFMSHNNPNFEY